MQYVTLEYVLVLRSAAIALRVLCNMQQIVEKGRLSGCELCIIFVIVAQIILRLRKIFILENFLTVGEAPKNLFRRQENHVKNALAKSEQTDTRKNCSYMCPVK